MADKAQTSDAQIETPTGAAPRRPPGHRGTDVRDAVAEMAARAQEISQEAGSKVAAAMKDVIHAAAGLAGFAVESARDLVQYMVRRGQMTPEEGDKLLREVEAAAPRRPAAAPRSVEPARKATPAASPAVASSPAPAAAPRKAASKAKSSSSSRPARKAAKAPGKKAAKKSSKKR